MKSEIKKDPDSFVNSHSYVESLVIHYRNKTSFFPDMREENKGYYKEIFYNDLIAELKNSAPPGARFFSLNGDGSTISIVLKGEVIFIFECSRGTSVAQIKMETSDFIDGFQVEGKYRKFFSSIFGW